MTVLMFSSCKDGFEYSPPEHSGMARVTISVTTNNGRSVLPDLSDLSDITRYELLGKIITSEEDEVSLGEESSARGWFVYLAAGIWNFTLNAYKGNGEDAQLILQGKLSSEIITMGDNNQLYFELSPLSSNGGKGNIEITFEFPASAGVVSVIATCVDNYSLDYTYTINAGVTNFTYTKNNVDSGDYFISFNFLDTSNTSLRVVSEYVEVRDGLTSKKTIMPFALTVTVPGNHLTEKLTWIENHTFNHVEYIVEVDADDNLFIPKVLFYENINVTITLKSDNASIERIIRIIADTTYQNSLFTVGSGVTLVLGNNITLIGKGDNKAALVTINNGGTLVMNDESKITGNTNTVTYDGNGGGVFVNNNGTFNMEGGVISGNYATGNGGGVYVEENGTFTKTAGTIYGYDSSTSNPTDNMANSLGHAVYVNSSPATKQRDSTADGTVFLSYNSSGSDGGWEN